MVASPKRGARQTAYQLLVASSPEGLAAGQGDLWDSGRVESDQTLHVVYRGRTLRSGQQCYWKDDQGRRVGDHRLAPEWTAYRKRLQYQTYDVTDLLRQGDNAIGATLGEGWHAGPLMSRPALPSPVFRLLVRLDVEMAGGSRQSIVSDGSWRGTPVGEPRHPM
ncbi:MAG: alpha-L-rhamnosidase N-terminal domain-containing protein [Pirellulales bacterium]|nr:alpha-L-rhamnosidase N-terminal domain-containing protein [Pirellulales bacterium]